jgi:hypothetical protein
LIGSGAHCDLRLAPDEAAVEQLVIEAIGDDEVYARTRALQPVCLLNGAPFLEGRLSPASVLELAGIALRVQRVQRQDAGKKAQRKRQSATSPTIQALGLIAVALGLWNVLSPSEHGAGGALASDVQPPPAAAVGKEPCPVAGHAGAVAFAQQSLLEAESKRERAPFYPGDGALAVPLFAQAAACFSLAGDAGSAQQAREAARALAQQVADTMHVGHVRLERFLAGEQFADARHQAELLADMSDQHGEYRAWLAGVMRECELRADQVKR